MPTRKPLKLLAMATTNSARPYTIEAEKKLGRQTFRVEEAFSLGQIGGRVMPKLALESACCLALSELLAQSTPFGQILRLQLRGAKGMVLAGGRNQSDAAARQEHGCGDLTP